MNYHLPVRMVRAATAAALLASIAATALCASSHPGIGGGSLSEPADNLRRALCPRAAPPTSRLACLPTNCRRPWKQNVVVENKSGGGGVVGNDYVAKAQPDGYTVLVAITQIIQAPSLVAKLPYDVFKDLAPVTQVGLSTIVLVVPEQQPIKSVKELVDLAKANPGKLPYGSFGNATTSHLYGELLKKNADIDMTHVPYRGSCSPAERLARQHGERGVPVDLTTASAQIKAGKLRALAVGGEKRRTALPDVPTMGELGYPGFEIEGWIGVFVPAATPKDIVTKLSANWPASSPRPRA